MVDPDSVLYVCFATAESLGDDDSDYVGLPSYLHTGATTSISPFENRELAVFVPSRVTVGAPVLINKTVPTAVVSISQAGDLLTWTRDGICSNLNHSSRASAADTDTFTLDSSSEQYLQLHSGLEVGTLSLCYK